MDDKIKALYQKVIIRESKSPYHYEKPDTFDLSIEADSPVCGDRFELFLSLDGKKIRSVHFTGYGCAISKAATSVLLQIIDQQEVAVAKTRIHHFLDFIQNPETAVRVEELEENLQAFAAARDFPERQSCVTLSWKALYQSV